ncbi:MAG: C45 family autoproteolytic acyltransferase/hydrolase [Alphaproteobacteria bacterium]
MTVHTHYHDITADTPREMGLALGRTFGGALQPFLGALKPLREQARSYLAACLAFTRLHFPDYVEELEGYAEGAGVDLGLLWQMLLEDDINALRPEKCTSMATNKGRLIGHNEDWSADAAGRLFILRRTLRGRSLFELHYAGTLGGNALSINSSGLVQMINSLEGTPLDTSVPRVPTNIIGRFMADSADIEAALVKLQSIPRMNGYAHTLIQAKGTGHRLLELSQNEISAHEITQFPFVHANHYTLDDMLHCNRRPPAESESSRQRYAGASAGITAQMTPEQLMALLKNDSKGPDNSLFNRRTIAGAVMDLDAKCAWIHLASEPEKDWLRYGLDFL